MLRVIFNVISSYFKGCVTSSHKEYDYYITHPERSALLRPDLLYLLFQIQDDAV